MKNQMCGIFYHINRRAIFSRYKILSKKLSSSSEQNKFNSRCYSAFLPQRIASCFFTHQQHGYATRAIFPLQTICCRTTSWAGVFLQYHGVHHQGDKIAESISSTDEESDFHHEIEVMYNGRIKPSKEGSNNKEPIYFLSDLDHFMASPTKTIHLYKSLSKGNEGSVEVVKNSLSKLLSHYYPLAGKLNLSPNGKLMVECTDEGVILIEAKANCAMDEVLSRLDQSDTLLKFVYDVPAAKIVDIPLINVQVTTFTCGGFALGIVINHCMFDGISQAEYLKNWGRIARGLPLTAPLSLDRSIFNARDPPSPNPHPGFLQLLKAFKTKSIYDDDDDHNMEYKSILFDQEKILRLKRIAMKEGSGISHCSTFEVLTAFIWRARTKAFGIQSNEQLKLLFVVDVRSKLKPTVPKGFFGNAVVATNSLCIAGDLLEKEFSYAVELVQEAKRMVDEEYVKSFIDCFDLSMVQQSLATTLMISTSCDLNFHAMDFGWGEAIHAGPAVLPSTNGVLFCPYEKNKKGVIVKMGLPLSVMRDFEELVMQI